MQTEKLESRDLVNNIALLMRQECHHRGIRLLFLSGFLFFLIGCTGRQTQSDILCDLDIISQGLPISDITTDDTLYTFVSEYPVEINYWNKKVYIILHDADSLACVISSVTKEVEERIGANGQGPDDVNSLEFYANAATLAEMPQLVDCNTGKILSPDNDGKYRLDKLPVAWVSPLNKFGDKYVGKKAGRQNAFFSIFDKDGTILRDIEYPFNLKEGTKSKIHGREYLLSPYIFANKERGRIIAAMYFADAAFIYDSIGNLITTISIGTEKDIDEMLKKVIDNQSYWSYRGGCATDKSCFMRLSRYVADLDNMEMSPEKSILLEFDWSGRIQRIYKMEENVVSFCVDHDRNMWALKRTIHNDDEYYHVLRQHLN